MIRTLLSGTWFVLYGIVLTRAQKNKVSIQQIHGVFHLISNSQVFPGAATPLRNEALGTVLAAYQNLMQVVLMLGLSDLTW